MVSQFADRVIGLHGGRLVADLPAERLGAAERARIYRAEPEAVQPLARSEPVGIG
jgi:ABC-type phosphate/phosphonate transport system ATPase subunit